MLGLTASTWKMGPPNNSIGTTLPWRSRKGPVPLYRKEHIANEEQTVYSASFSRSRHPQRLLALSGVESKAI